jgi:hypothetical protein
MAWECRNNGWREGSKEVTGIQIKGGEERMDDVEFDWRYMGVKKMENKSFGQNRVGICREGRQDQT